MTKAELVQQIANNTGLEKAVVSKTVDAYMEHMKLAMIKGDNVFLRGFGSFVLKKRAAKKARNISKNTTMIIPAHFIPSFKPAKEFLTEVSANVHEDKKGKIISKVK